MSMSAVLPSDIFHLQLSVSNYPFAEMIYTSDGSCSNVVSGFDLRVLTGVAFSANNLQHKVRRDAHVL